ncbi:MAG TPA: hypothetical protein VGM88_17355 [Kofleriaceae bacterium]|jgi:hypothetical protein
MLAVLGIVVAGAGLYVALPHVTHLARGGESPFAADAVSIRPTPPAPHRAHEALPASIAVTAAKPADDAELEAAWRDAKAAAEHDENGAATVAAWRRLAALLADRVARCTVHQPTDAPCLELVQQLATARRGLVQAQLPPEPTDTPTPLTDDTKAFVDALDLYVDLDPAGPDAAGDQFIAANVYRRSGQIDEAVARFSECLFDHPYDETGEYAANLLLDSLVNAGRLDELRDWTLYLLSDPEFLVAHPDVAATLEHIRPLL